MNTQRALFTDPGTHGRPLLVLVAALMGASACSDAHGGPIVTSAAPPVPVRVVAVERVALARPLRAIGRLSQKRSLTLSFKNGGTVRTLFVQEGAMVKKGQRLALVDQTEIEAQVAQARAAVDKADRDRERVEKLRASAAAAQNDLDNAHTAADIAHASLTGALYNHTATVLYAPEDGRIDKRFVEVGEQVAPGRPIFGMSGTQAGVVLRAGVVDRELPGLRVGDRAEVSVDALPGEIIAATVSEIASVPSLTSGTYELELRLAASSAPLVAGMTAKVEIVRRTGPPLPVVPLGALVDAEGTHAAIYTLLATATGHTVKKVPIVIAFFAGDRVAVQSGLSGNERVVSEGASFVEPGRSVRPVETTEVADARH